MRTNEERIILVHRRAEELRKERDRTLLRAWGTAAVCLFLCLMNVAADLCTGPHNLAAGTVMASSMLSDSAGGYVLTGIVAFMAGVCITVALIRSRIKNGDFSVSKSGQKNNAFTSFPAVQDTQMQAVAGGSEEIEEQKTYTRKREE